MISLNREKKRTKLIRNYERNDNDTRFMKNEVIGEKANDITVTNITKELDKRNIVESKIEEEHHHNSQISEMHDVGNTSRIGDSIQMNTSGKRGTKNDKISTSTMEIFLYKSEC